MISLLTFMVRYRHSISLQDIQDLHFNHQYTVELTCNTDAIEWLANLLLAFTEQYDLYDHFILFQKALDTSD